ncbi:MAG: TolC family protein [Elusimicrobia bacterium]|nr:TolC family protein [Elusimicrobiota bacterium]
MHRAIGLSALLVLGTAARAQEGGTTRLSLEEYERLALEQSLRMRTARDTLRSQEYGRELAVRPLYLPSLSAEAEAGRAVSEDGVAPPIKTDTGEGRLSLTQPFLTGTDLSVTGSVAVSESRVPGPELASSDRSLPAWSASLTQPLYLFVGNPRLRARRRADLAYQGASDAKRSEELAVLVEARSLYYAMTVAAESLYVEQAKLESARSVHRISQELVKAGRLAPVETARADIRLKRDMRRVQNANSLRHQAANQLKDFVLLASTATVRLATPLEYRPFEEPLELLLALAARQNPDLRAARRSAETAQLDLSDAREGNRPRLSLNGTYAFERNRPTPGSLTEPKSWSALVGLNWPLFDGTQTRLRARQARIAIDNLRRDVESRERELLVAVRNAYLDLKRAEEQVRDFEPQGRSARQNLEVVRLQYKNGLARLIDVFDAENELRDLELESLNLLSDFNRARDRLGALVGLDPRDVGAP